VNSDPLFQELEQFPYVLTVLLRGVSQSEACHKPDMDTWSILEVVCHLVDEESDDFRERLDYILNRQGEKWKLIDPGTWVVTRAYAERELGERLDTFCEERQRSLAWLRDLDAPDWDTSYKAPFGVISAGDVLAAWVAHDNLHLRQLVELKRVRLLGLVKPYDVRYAGDW